MERTISTNELIAIELVKAWCLQPTTHGGTWKFDEVLKSYDDAINHLTEIDDKSNKEKVANELIN